MPIARWSKLAEPRFDFSTTVTASLKSSSTLSPPCVSSPAGALPEATEWTTRWPKAHFQEIMAGGVAEAVEHIRRFGSEHTEAILTNDWNNAQQFVNALSAAAIFVNASTRFNDGAQFGLGAEVAISTQKLHARGPMGLEALTSYKWIALGDGHVRP